MKRIVSCGELLIDFIPNKKGKKLKHIETFHKMPGGAPANVCVQASKLGAKTSFIGQIGNDGFGDFLKHTLSTHNVDVNYVFQTTKAKTALAFVTLTSEGERDFVFYRNPSADQLLTIEQVKDIKMDNVIFHFCSLSLDNYPLRNALDYLINTFKSKGNLISFDPNLRHSLFDDHSAYRDIIDLYINKTDILKISDDELYFITKKNNEKDAITYLLSKGITCLIITRGKDGVTYIDRQRTLNQPGYKVDVVDTTGAGDSWIGAFLAKLSLYDHIVNISDEDILYMLSYANATAALTTTHEGAISALPDAKEVDSFLKLNLQLNK